MIFSSIRARLITICLGMIWLSNAILFYSFAGDNWWLLGLVLIFISLLAVSLINYFFTPLSKKLKALEAGLLNFKDNDFSNTLNLDGKDEISQIGKLYNDVAVKLRTEKQHIYQRELLLDKVIESSPIVMFLVDDDDFFVYSNRATRHFLYQGKPLEGNKFSVLKKQWPDALKEALAQHLDGLFTIEHDSIEDTWHLSRGEFLLNNKKHHLFLLKQMTRELNRQEVAVWKKVIRVISHELNNSLAPISSVTHSGNLIASKLANDKLVLIFETIRERIEHLNHFILGYARFAKLPSPLIENVGLDTFIEKLATQFSFELETKVPSQTLLIDSSQIEQVFINLLKNAEESGSDKSDITMAFQLLENSVKITIQDRGTGMSEHVLKNALIPFYSTKQTGTGLGLALCREIIEAHHGRISLYNRIEGGLAVVLELPKANK
ncbi:sensor histidine kinase [Thalassotalea piscium]|uniref:histidine kinase n=1 Tax=Thalassotalea piscium TaxID=1230533 RepID=A0A7X0NK31_9GAMM|nr:ATP-binding protein [Thalassotalea piscium]MBB6544927.1 nitrogen fixation/metabolism regulation signal transduction histidine kinase [Thalassotalea piscium]